MKNTGSAPAKITIAGSVVNPVGYDGVGTVDGLGHDKFGQNVNEIKATPSLRGLAMSSRKVKPEDGRVRDDGPDDALARRRPTSPTGSAASGGTTCRSSGTTSPPTACSRTSAEASPSPDKQTDVGTLGLVATIAPGREVVLPFILSWNFPNVLNYFDIVPEQRGRIFKNHYAEKYPDAWAAAEYLQTNLGRLEASSRAFHDAFFSSTLPPYVLDAVSSQAAIIRTTTGLWLEGGQLLRLRGLRRPVAAAAR